MFKASAYDKFLHFICGEYPWFDMCPVIVASKVKYTGTVTPPSLGTETTVVEIPAQSDEYMVEGYIDLSSLASGDTMTVTEYVALDGVNYQVFASASFSGPVGEPVVRFHTKTLPAEAKYRVTVTQTSGTLRSVRYALILEVLASV